MDYIFIAITILWLLEFIIFPSPKIEKNEKKKSFSLILFSIILVIFLNVIFINLDLLILKHKLIKPFALLLYFLGLALRYSSSFLLKDNFSRNVVVSKKQKLVSKGPYKYIRHPLYLGLILLTISVPLYFGNILVFIFSLILMTFAINIRIAEEEKAMEKVLKERYLNYKSKRKKFIPFIY